MSYSEASGYPMEPASKSSHSYVIKNPAVQEFLAQCHISLFDRIPDDADRKIETIDDNVNNPIQIFITIDGGYSNVPIKEEYPSVSLAFIQIGALLFKYADLKNLKSEPFIDPTDIRKMENIERSEFVIPTQGIILGNNKNLINSVRQSIYDFYKREDDDSEYSLIKTLKWLLFEEYSPQKKDVWHLSSCPHCGIGVDLCYDKLTSDYKYICPHCLQEIYLTDTLRLHEAISDEQGAGGILGYLTTTTEQMLIAEFIQVILSTNPDLLNHTLFVRDGPLAFFGQTANLHKPFRNMIKFVSKKWKINLIGVEKSGSFVDHAALIKDTLSPGEILLLGNNYIYKYILPGDPSDPKPYASSSYYGCKAIFKSEKEDLFVVTLPCLEPKPEPQRSDYLNMDIALKCIQDLRCHMYNNSLIPVVLANSLVSLSSHPSSDILRDFARSNING